MIDFFALSLQPKTCLLFFGGVSNVSAQEPEEEEIEFGILGAILLQNMVMGNIT